MEEKQASGLWTSTTEDTHRIEDIWMAPAALYMRKLIHTEGYEDDPRVREIDREVVNYPTL